MIEYTVVGPGGAERRTGDADAIRAAAAVEDSCVWVHFDAPEVTLLRTALAALDMDHFGLDPAPGTYRRPKIETYEGSAMVLIKTVWYIEETRQVETGDFTLFNNGRSLVTVRRGVVDPSATVRERLDEPEFRSGGIAEIVHALFDIVVEQYDGAIEDLADDVHDVERAVFSSTRTDHNEEIYFLIRETLEFQSAVRPLIPFAELVRRHKSHTPVFRTDRFAEVAGHLIRVDAAVETCMSLLTTVLTAHQGQIGTWQNDDMRKISAWAAMAVVPTAIAGIYGMNFTHMPELHWTFGYPLVLALIVVICLLLYRGFKRNGWL
ncbi:magnesium and cobalt transport protein CorA [Glycomyces sp. NPDC046736]|uniref:magnesium and cobalt transport protein CorA n=1 Tax=Glycomyces sp. NPDC046736 TaxID=3155615 RepID=UPI0033DBCB0B